MQETVNVAFCCDQFALPGLYLSIYTLLASNPVAPLHLFLVYEGLSDRVLKSLEASVKELRPNAKLTPRKFSTRDVRFADGFFGNYMTYARLFLADLLPEIDRLIYLDSDLIVNCPIDGIWQIELHGCLFGAVSGGSIEDSILDRDFLLETGLPKNTPAFNCGVLLLDLALWRAKRATEQCLNFLAANPGRFRIADQTLLNGLYSQHAVPIPKEFNIGVSRFIRNYKDGLPSGIFHFDANPKPWDFLGKRFHSNWILFDDACRRLSIPRRKAVFFFPSIVRTFRIARSYVAVLNQRFKNKRQA